MAWPSTAADEKTAENDDTAAFKLHFFLAIIICAWLRSFVLKVIFQQETFLVGNCAMSHLYLYLFFQRGDQSLIYSSII